MHGARVPGWRPRPKRRTRPGARARPWRQPWRSNSALLPTRSYAPNTDERVRGDSFYAMLPIPRGCASKLEPQRSHGKTVLWAGYYIRATVFERAATLSILGVPTLRLGREGVQLLGSSAWHSIACNLENRTPHSYSHRTPSPHRHTFRTRISRSPHAYLGAASSTQRCSRTRRRGTARQRLRKEVARKVAPVHGLGCGPWGSRCRLTGSKGIPISRPGRGRLTVKASSRRCDPLPFFRGKA